MKMKAALSRGNLMSKSTEAKEGPAWGSGCQHVAGASTQPHIMKGEI